MFDVEEPVSSFDIQQADSSSDVVESLSLAVI